MEHEKVPSIGQFLCPICLNLINDEVPLKNICMRAQEHGPIHRECLKAFVEQAIFASISGTCPTITCPHFHDHKVMLNFKTWGSLVSPLALAKYYNLSSSLLSILCGGCHSLRTLAVDVMAVNQRDRTIPEDPLMQTKAVFTTLKSHGIIDELNEFEACVSDLKAYEGGLVSADALYSLLFKRYLAKLQWRNDREAWGIFKNLLPLIANPERRHNLHLRYLRDRPRCWTPCCEREHCFRCKTKDFHTNKTCEENLDVLDSSIVSCPSCSLSLVKGDGCNSVTCLCGRQFSWTVEKDITDRALQFKELYPIDPHRACVEVLCQSQTSNGNIGAFVNEPLVELELQRSARAWRQRNLVQSNVAFAEHWRRTLHPFCPTQCCNLITNTSVGATTGRTDQLADLPEGIRIAAEIWAGSHVKEIQQAARETHTAVKSLFLSLFPTDDDRFYAARDLLYSGRSCPELWSSTTPTSAIQPCNAMIVTMSRQQHIMTKASDVSALIASAKLWVDENKETFNAKLEQWELSSTLSFLFIYGMKSIFTTTPCPPTSFPSPMEWDLTLSNSSLIFSNRNTSALRRGSVSCYPAAIAELPSARSSLTVILEKAPRGPNWLTFGLARRGITNSSSDGIGRTLNSYGICDDRSIAAGNLATLMASGTTLTQCRKLIEGDVLKAVVDVIEGWLDIFINETDFSFRFDIPITNPNDYLFAVTFANDHQVTIIQEPMNFVRGLGTLNREHSIMYSNLRRVMRKLITDPQTMSSNSTETSGVNYDAIMCHPRVLERVASWRDHCESMCSAESTGDGLDGDLKDKDSDPALNGYLILKPYIQAITQSVVAPNNVDISCHSNERDNGLRSDTRKVLICTPTWNNIFNAACWHFHRCKNETDLKMTEDARTFLQSYGDSAPFIAAAVFAPVRYSSCISSSADIVRQAAAFMNLFADEMQEWYSYNVSLKEPMLGLDAVPAECKCLPRHVLGMNICPKSSNMNPK